MPAKKPSREPLDALIGLIAGTLWGIAVGVICLLKFAPITLLFPGDIVVVFAIVFAVLGYFKGDDFFRWVRDH